MTEIPEETVTRLLREHLARDELPDDARVTFRLSGGAPSTQVLEEFRMAGSGRAEVARSDEVRSLPREEGELQLRSGETRELFELVMSGLDAFVPRSRAAFLPDTVLACLSVEVDGRTADFFCEVDEELEPLPPSGAQAAVGPLLASTISTFRSFVSSQLDDDGRAEAKDE